jgi:hypothetical protein
MGWSYKKSISVGPVRLSVGKTGVGYSVGGKGFRTGVRANGRRYSRVSAPGTGFSYGVSHSRATRGGCVIVALAALSGSLISLWFAATLPN